MGDSRTYPDRIYAGHLGGGRRTWKPELFDASEAAHSCEYVRRDIADAAPDLVEALLQARAEIDRHSEFFSEDVFDPLMSRIDAALSKAGVKA